MISVIIPAFNASAYIGETLDSVLRQGALLGEVVVVDDASRDNTVSLVEAYKDPRIQILSRPQSSAGGVSAVRNAGLAAATGDWVLFLDADDRLLPGALDTLFAGVEGANCAAVYGDYQRIDSKGCPIGNRAALRKRHKPSGEIFDRIIQGNFIVNGGVMLIKKDAFQATGGFSEAINYCEDWLAWCRLAAGNSINYLPGAVVLEYRVHQDSTMMKKPLRFEDCLPAVNAIYADPIMMSALAPDKWKEARNAAESHIRSYVSAQDVRSRRYLSALSGVFKNLIAHPSGAHRTLGFFGAALLGF